MLKNVKKEKRKARKRHHQKTKKSLEKKHIKDI